ncbi:NADP oxidoreductase [Streptomyces eurocidicus]|uniref:F420-dependent oxidoreductase-like protein n=2 Tax=Streptomyces eurocidicus TaxID=66423 RepID=A0A2N8NSY7_STREU|nr:LLM class F420-dependent oxidoreductase [Streptomyces eurocidicus]MBB5120131.1 F420-dependent oxidoreductase-like protein [Streptomyces eurocidicus]PNE31895.1 NADP oxidoreductase [Streptomyces eurocidicus]
MKFGYHSGYWSAKPPTGVEGLVAEAERLGFDSLWTAEAYGSDAVAPLAWWGARTERLRLGTGIMQMSARTPTATAMTALTLDHLSGGRFVLGLGASGPQVVEGWYGLPYPKPLARTREYVDIVRAVIARERPVEYAGEHYRLPFPGGTGLGKPLKSTLHPLRREIPILLAAEGPKNVALAGEIADGWLPFFFSPRSDAYYRERLAEGFRKRSGERSPAADFEVLVSAPIVLDDDLERGIDKLRPLIALYVGGMGAKGANFHADVVARMGYEADVEKIQNLYLAGHKKDAVAAVPAALVQDVALVGGKDKIRDDLAAWDETVVTTMLVRDEDPRVLRTIAELMD